jgi:hypothetical protein
VPLYRHGSGERVRPVTGSREHRRLREAADWHEVVDGEPEQLVDGAAGGEPEQLDGDADEPDSPTRSDHTWPTARAD